jgi:HK97 family phage major capsid protein
MYPNYLRNAAWLVHPDVTVQLHQLFVVAKTDAGTTISAGGLVFNPEAQAGAPFGTLYGRPIFYTQHCETVGDVGDVILADLAQYRSVVKGTGIQSMASPHFWFDQDVMAFRFIFRMGGGPKFETTISPRDGSNTMAAFLTITQR